MTDRFINVATAAAVTLQLTVSTVFFGAVVAMTLIGFSVIPGPY